MTGGLAAREAVPLVLTGSTKTWGLWLPQLPIFLKTKFRLLGLAWRSLVI